MQIPKPSFILKFIFLIMVFLFLSLLSNNSFNLFNPLEASTFELNGGEIIHKDQKDGLFDTGISELYQSAMKQINLGKLNKAENIYKKINKEHPKSALPYLGLAAVAVKRGNNDDAISYYKKALIFDSMNGAAYRGLAVIYYYKRECKKSKLYFLEASKYSSGFDYDKKAKPLIEHCQLNAVDDEFINKK